ncbi:MAG: ferrochelatase [Gammaproteobacteria bacterium]|nr:MAG: ferrochelatase [Gammaproteobacteria bacterium]
MSRFKSQALNFSRNNTNNNNNKRTGVLLANLGTPAQATPSALRNYLREFLSDPRVVEIPRLLWLLILHGIILRSRPKKSAKLYQNIWTEQGSPLMVISRKQQAKVAEKLAETYGSTIPVELAMRYGQPSIAQALQTFQKNNIDNIIILPLYPQYSGPTTGSTFDAVIAEIKQWRWVPSLHFINGYHQNPLYIQALANSVAEHIKQQGKPDRLVISYHGMPQAFYDWGDPYADFCQQTSKLLVQQLEQNNTLTATDIVTCYQSRFGKAQWLTPYTENVLTQLPQDGHKNIAIISPAFSVDCLETLDEIEREYRKVYLAAGGEHYHYIAALNDNDDHIDALIDVISPYLP